MKLITIIASVILGASVALGAVFSDRYDLAINKAASEVTISGADMIQICGFDAFPTGVFSYSINDEVLNLRATTDEGLDFNYVSGDASDLLGVWAIEDEGVRVELAFSSNNVVVTSICE